LGLAKSGRQHKFYETAKSIRLKPNMKICPYCGKENRDASLNCPDCGVRLPLAPAVAAAPKISPSKNLPPENVDLAKSDGAMPVAKDFPYPDWKQIGNYVRKTIPPAAWNDAWREPVAQWLEKIRVLLGPDFFLDESDHFFLVCNQDPEERGRIVKFAENVQKSFQAMLNGVKLRETYGKQVILIFGDLEVYYRYISHFYPNGQHNLNGGVFLRGGGYAHVALPVYDRYTIQPTLVHELAHNALFTLPLPRWLNEGVAQIFELQFTRVRGTGFDQDMDMADQHHAYWNSKTIQEFWAGDSFLSVDGVHLSYSLAKIVVDLMADEKGNFKNFLQNANDADAGEAACRQTYGKSLGQIAGVFLGPGNWNPKLNP
jgi:hypothetical protein